MCSETSEAVGTTWEHAQLEFQIFFYNKNPPTEDLNQADNYKSSCERLGSGRKVVKRGKLKSDGVC